MLMRRSNRGFLGPHFYPMKTVTTKSKQQIAADFLTIFQNVKSMTKAKPVTPQDRMKPYRKEILKLRRRGLSWKQIARGMRQPPINERVSTKLLSSVFGGELGGEVAGEVRGEARGEVRGDLAGEVRGEAQPPNARRSG
jgi:hypothetical protein